MVQWIILSLRTKGRGLYLKFINTTSGFETLQIFVGSTVYVWFKPLMRRYKMTCFLRKDLSNKHRWGFSSIWKRVFDISMEDLLFADEVRLNPIFYYILHVTGISNIWSPYSQTIVYWVIVTLYLLVLVRINHLMK